MGVGPFWMARLYLFLTRSTLAGRCAPRHRNRDGVIFSLRRILHVTLNSAYNDAASARNAMYGIFSNIIRQACINISVTGINVLFGDVRHGDVKWRNEGVVVKSMAWHVCDDVAREGVKVSPMYYFGVLTFGSFLRIMFGPEYIA